MSNQASDALGLLSRLVIACFAILILAGVVWHGVTFATFVRIWHDLVARPGGPMKFRFVLQPLMAAIVAIHDGRNDARTGRSPFLRTMLRERSKRAGRLREALNATARIILLGIGMDVIYQVLVLKTFYPAEAVIIALLLAFVPYVIIRGPVARAARRRRGGMSSHGLC